MFLQVIDQIKGGYFSQGNPNEFKDIVDNLLYHDRFLTLADYDSYIAAQDKVSAAYRVSFFNFDLLVFRDNSPKRCH